MVEQRWRRNVVRAIRYALLALIGVIMLYPFLYMLSTSFKRRTFILDDPLQLIPSDPTFQNYVDAVVSNHFGLYFLNSAGVAIASTALIVFLSSMMAYGFSRFQFRGKRALFVGLIVGLTIPGMMLIIPQFLLARDLGLLNSLPGLVPFYVGGSLAFNTFLLSGFFETIPRELDEAMLIDGASAWRRYWNLIMPLSRPAIATCAIFAFLGTWDEYVWALTVLNDPDSRTLPIAISLFQGQHSTSWGLVFAASMIAIVPVVIVYVVFQRQLISGVMNGALKN